MNAQRGDAAQQDAVDCTDVVGINKGAAGSGEPAIRQGGLTG